ncbi:MAG: imidazolonepropionase [Blastocatellia bacterium]|nr:imidazolonepropionase [Blastocatellia bacterium]
MNKKLALVNIGQLVTLAGSKRPRINKELGNLSIIEDAALICSGEKIEKVGKNADLCHEIDQDYFEIVDALGSVVTPGLVDAHTHLVFAGSREKEYEMKIEGKSYQEIATLGGGIRSTVRSTRDSSEEQLYLEARKHLHMLLANGTTTIEAKSGYGLSVVDELKILRIIQRLNSQEAVDIIATFLGAHEIPDEYRQDRKSYIDLIVNEMLPSVAEKKLASYCDIFCESHVFSIEESRYILSAAKQYGFGLRLHADQLTLSGGAKLAAELGAKTADHLEQIGSEEIALLKEAGVFALLLPGSVFHLGLKRYPPAREMIESGLAVVIATDFNPGSSPTPSLPMIMSLACTQMRMTPAEALTACTINAAYSLDKGDLVGSVEPGKLADLTIFDCKDYRQIPYFFGANLVKTVIKAGKIAYKC